MLYFWVWISVLLLHLLMEIMSVELELLEVTQVLHCN